MGKRGQTFDKLARDQIHRFPGMVHVPVDFELDPGFFAADGFHPSERGYVEFGRGMAQALNKANLNSVRRIRGE